MTKTKRTPFIAPLVDGAAKFIEARGAVTIDQLAEYLVGAGVDVRGHDVLNGKQLAHWLGVRDFDALPDVATGSNEFVLITAALFINRNVELDSSDPTLVKLKSRTRLDGRGGKLCDDKTRTGGHYHVLFVRDPGGPAQVAECFPGKCDLSFAGQWVDEIYLRASIDEGWEAIWIVGCGPDRCRRDKICDLPVEEWGEPHWGSDPGYEVADDENPYLVGNVDADEPPF
jgi:hypothetical protein